MTTTDNSKLGTVARIDAMMSAGVTPPLTGPLYTREEAVVELFDDAIRSNIELRIVQLDPLGADPNRCLLVVGGHAVAQVLVTNLLTVGTPFELSLVAQARKSAVRAGRPDPVLSASAGAVPRSVESEPADDTPAAEFETPWAGEVAIEGTPAEVEAPPVDMGRAADKPPKLIIDDSLLDEDGAPAFLAKYKATGGVRRTDAAKVEGW